jgi:hypothetical protein
MNMDKTAYARSIGYTGRKPVFVYDGKVTSHRNADWFEFCDRCRKSRQTRRNSSLTTEH